jgi:hypothetical protein
MTNIYLLYVSVPGRHIQVKGTQCGNTMWEHITFSGIITLLKS